VCRELVDDFLENLTDVLIPFTSLNDVRKGDKRRSNV